MGTPRRILSSVPKADNMTGSLKREIRAPMAEWASFESSVWIEKILLIPQARNGGKNGQENVWLWHKHAF